MNWLDMVEPITRDKDKRSPMYLRITEFIRLSIESGALGEDERLPPDRELAKLLKVDRSTIARAYDQLESDGLVYSHVGRGTFVSRRKASRQKMDTRQRETGNRGSEQIVWADKFSRASESVAAIVQRQPALNPQSDTISFAAGAPNEEFFPAREFNEIVSSILPSPRSAELFGYSQPEGHPALREQVRAYLKEQGIDAADNELLILSGSQQGIDLVARTLIDKDDVVLMEDPTYFWAICTFTSNGARCLPVAAGDQGIRLEVFENVASQVDAKLLYTMPSFQNPTGSTMPVERRKRLLELARRYQVPILEDNYVGDLYYGDAPSPTLRSLDEAAGTVIYQGTFSKALCPGLRLGWLVASEPVMTRLRLAKRTCDLSTNSMAQLILAEYLRQGLYKEHLQNVQSVYRQRLDVMCEALEASASQWLSFQRPDGGMFVWAKLPPGYSARELLPFAQREGVLYSPGDVFYVSGGSVEYMRLNFIQQTPEQIREGIQRLGRALQAYAGSRKRLVRSGDGLVLAESTFI